MSDILVTGCRGAISGLDGPSANVVWAVEESVPVDMLDEGRPSL